MPGCPWLLPCSLLLSCLPSSHPSPCQQVVDSAGKVYQVENQMGEDSKTCQKDSFLFTMGGKRYCFTDQQAEGSTFTDVRCKGANPPSVFPPSSPPSPPPGPECQTPSCKKFSERVLSAMDPSVEPCQDFHKFACGKYKGKWSAIELTDIMIKQSREILKDPPNPSQEPWEQNLRYILLFQYLTS